MLERTHELTLTTGGEEMHFSAFVGTEKGGGGERTHVAAAAIAVVVANRPPKSFCFSHSLPPLLCFGWRIL